MRGYVDCVGCEQRRLDAQRVVDFFNANEVEIVNRPQDCDVAVLVTCGVDSFSERKSLNRIADIDRERLPSSRLLIGGCLPAICPEKLKEFNVHGMFSPRDFQLFDHVLETPRKAQSISDYASPNTSVFDYIEDVLSTEDADLTRRRDYDRAKNGFRIVIDEGCLLNCAYCVIRYATGRLKSRPIEVIIEEFRHGLDLHQPTLMLMGGDTGAYGWDTGAHLHDLLRKLLAFDGDYHIYIHDFNINWAIKELDAYCAVF
ncbi:partial tRNA-2-methylthio-N(6)-dimethylallyladenosine synthase, partial [Anaerolineae bacterium]